MICFDAIHYVWRPIMEAKERLRTYSHLIKSIIGYNKIVLDSMSKLSFKNRSKCHQILSQKGGWEITVSKGKKRFG